MPFFYYYDPYYWMILVPAMLIALLAQLNVSATFNRYSRISSARGFTGAQAAEARRAARMEQVRQTTARPPIVLGNLRRSGAQHRAQL